MVAFPFKLKDDIHHVLEHLRSGQRAFLGDVADKKHRNVVLLGKPRERSRRLSNLRHRTRGRLHFREEHGLNGIDDDCIRLIRLQFTQHRLGVRLSKHEKRRRNCPQSLGPHADLFRAFFARYIEDALGVCSHVQHGLKHEGGFADARFTAEQHHGAGNNALSQHAVQFCVTCRCPAQFEDFDIRERFGLNRLQRGSLPAFAGRIRANRKGLQCIPRFARGALAYPLH